MNSYYSFLFFILFAFSHSFSVCAYPSSPDYIALADSADFYIKREKWAKAEETIIRALRLEPGNFSNSQLFSNLGIVQSNQGRHQEALESFRLGLSIAPRSTTLRNNRARTRMLLSDYVGALEDLNESLKTDSIQEWPLQMRGLIFLQNDNLEAAEKDFLFLIANFPKNEVAMTGLGRIAEKKNRNDDALRYYDEALLISDDAETRSLRILLKIKLEKYSEASADIRKSLEKYPREPIFYVLRGYLHRLNYRNEEADADKKIALEKGADPIIVEQFLP
ncbi:MAG: tetratricopeptide repeat protein [Muribaculaceae bacterium]|nr:tetratricopeptide repeat protein [Muribaculaceae bacterium]MDE6753288.1 tetratricopeptide repeat protein [Muribaculaceae bacterium]